LGASRGTANAASSGGQKFVILQSRSQTPTTQQQLQHSQVQVQQKPTQATKLVVVCMPNANHSQSTVTQVLISFFC
jgi:transcription initiation factor TFIID subunit 6